MADIKRKGDAIILKDGAVTCECCGKYQMVIRYDWYGTGQYDLDTGTSAFGELVGWSCGDSGTYVQWISKDDTTMNGTEQVDIRVDDARADGLWTSSYNITCMAGWYENAEVPGSGPATLRVSYKNKSKQKQISPGSQKGCASSQVATITVYKDKQPDGSYFAIM